MKVIASLNTRNTVGLCDDLKREDMKYSGTYSPQDLLEWATNLVKLYEDAPVMIFEHSSSSVLARMLAASPDGENPFVGVTSRIESSGKKVLE